MLKLIEYAPKIQKHLILSYINFTAFEIKNKKNNSNMIHIFYS